MRIKGRGFGDKVVKGDILFTKEPISFLGGVDPDNGEIIEKNHEIKGKKIKDKILVFPRGKGSTVGSYIIYQLKKNNKAPLALINIEAEPIVAVGAIISEIPLIDQVDIEKIPKKGKIKVNAKQEWIEF